MRLLQIVYILSKFLVFYKFTTHRKQGFGLRLKLAFETLGLTFVKIGQILSMRYDLLPRGDCESLQMLLDKSNPMAFGSILEILEKEYGRKPYEMFKKIYPMPLGSASVSQVHKAELFSGALVAVKIKRPGVDSDFLADIVILKRLAFFAEIIFPRFRYIQVRQLVQYFESWIKQDLDFAREVQNMEKIREQYKFAETNLRHDLGKGIFPKSHKDLCTQNIIVMDYINGIPMSRREEILARPDFNAEKSITSFVTAAMRNWFKEDQTVYLFQADPHLSNILALPHGDAASIDYGLIAELTKKEATQCKDLVIAVYLQDMKKVLKITADMTGVKAYNITPALQADLEEYVKKTRGEGFGFWFLEFVRIMVNHKLKFPLFLTTFGRTNVILDGLVKTYMPEKTTLDLLGEELKRQAVREAFKNLKDVEWLKVGYTLSEKVKQAPDIIGKIIDNPLEALAQVARAVRGI